MSAQDSERDFTRTSPAWPDRRITATTDGDEMLFYEVGEDSEYADGGWISTDYTENLEDRR